MYCLLYQIRLHYWSFEEIKMLRIFFVQCNQHEPTWKSDCYRMKTNKQKETMRSKQITAQTHTCFIMYVTIESNCNFSNNNKYRENIKSPFHWHYVSIQWWYNVLYCKDMPCSLHSVLWKYSESLKRDVKILWIQATYFTSTFCFYIWILKSNNTSILLVV